MDTQIQEAWLSTSHADGKTKKFIRFMNKAFTSEYDSQIKHDLQDESSPFTSFPVFHSLPLVGIRPSSRPKGQKAVLGYCIRRKDPEC